MPGSSRVGRRSCALWLAAALALLLAPSTSLATGPWGAPVTLSGYGEETAWSQVAMNAAGGAVVVWTSGARGVLRAASRPAGGVFQRPTTLSSADAYGPVVAVNDSGAAIVAWASERGERSRVMAAWRPSAASRFLPAVAVSAPQARGTSPEIALNAAGEAVVTWGQFDGSRLVVQAAFGRPGAPFTAPVAVSGPLGEPTYLEPQASVDAAGNAIVVWEGGRGAHGVVEGAIRPAGGRFAPPIKLSAGNESYEPDVATNARGESVLAWKARAPDGASFLVRGSLRPPGGAFGPPIDLSGPEEDIYGPDVAIGDSGDALVAWTPESYAGGPELVDAAVRAPGGPLVPLPDISPRGQEAFYPTVAVGPGGAMAAVWMTGEPLSGAAGAVGAAGAFAAGDLASGRAHLDLVVPDVDVDATGRAIAVWTSTTDSRRSIVAAGSGDLGRALHAGLPSLRGLALTRSRLRAARSGPAFGARAAPRTVIRFTLDEPASVLFSVERAAFGRRSGIGTCEAPGRRNRSHRPCTRFVPVGRQTLEEPAGAVRVRFGGRIGGRPLPPGRYRIVAVPSAAGRRGNIARAPLRIVR